MQSMLSRFCIRSRSLLAMLLTISLVSASLLAVGAEAIADVLSDEIIFSVADEDTGDHITTEKLCNHGCHAQTHLTGFDSRVPLLGFATTQIVVSNENVFDFSSRPCDNLFRPPKNAFQA